MNIRPFDEMTALLIGASSGVGLESAAQLAAAGVPRMVICARDPARGERARRTLIERAPRCTVQFVAADASTPLGVASVIQAAESLGGIDILLNAVPGNVAPRPFIDSDPDTYSALIDVHLHSVLRVTRAALPFMTARGGGVVINVASDAAKIPTPGESVHGALMAAIAMFSRTLALEEARHGIRVHALTPSIIADTLSYERMMAEPFSAKLFCKALKRASLGVPIPADVAALVVFLCSPAAAKMTGQTLTVNGGLAVA